jgi:uncharacterized protein with HEPN domain
MSRHDPSVYLQHVLDALERIQRYTVDGREAFLASSLVSDAVVRNLEVVGEAVKQLPPEVRDLAPEVPWRRIAGMRDVLIHEYFGVDLEVVWRVVEVELPLLRDAVRRVLFRYSAATSES